MYKEATLIIDGVDYGKGRYRNEIMDVVVKVIKSKKKTIEEMVFMNSILTIKL